MKGLIVFALCLLSLGVEASIVDIQTSVIELKTHSGITFSNLSLQEGTKVLKLLEADENIELRNEIIYPEEVSELVYSRLTKFQNVEKRPNQDDYN